MKKTISIFGSSGSIGRSTTKVLLNSPDSYQVIVLAVKNDIKSLIAQAKVLMPQYAVVADERHYEELKLLLASLPQIKVLAGQDAINESAKIKCDLFISAIVGMAALVPTINAIRAGSNIGLANKECLVAAGDVILQEAKKHNVKLLPIDSEHNAIFQIFENDNIELIKDITLTASGGPFFNSSLEQMSNVTKEQAIKHPNWSMGAKISVDSATMMNKGLEVIEAFRLFDVTKEQVKIIVHPESIIHGLVSYEDGSTLAVLSNPDMQIPISYATGYPKRIKIKHQSLDLIKIGSLNFYEPDEKRFPAIKLSYQALESGGNAPCVLNAANEIAVDRFLKDQIKFVDITKIIMEVLDQIPYSEIPSLESVIEFDKKAREVAAAISV